MGDSWVALASRADALTLRFYERLFAIDASAAKLFEGVDMSAQRNKLAQSLAVLVRGLGDPGRLLPALTALGKRHANYGVEWGHFDSVRTALLDALDATLGEAFTPAVRRAWGEAYALIASGMKRAMESGDTPA